MESDGLEARPPARRARANGQGRLSFVRAGSHTVIGAAEATSPLRLLTPQNHGHGAWVFLASLGGGLVDGDAVQIEVEVGPGATGLLGTQASTKVYRCPSATCRQALAARVAEGGVLVMVPDPVVCFAGARYEQAVQIELAASATLVAVDAFTAGRSARGERWDFHRYAARSAVARQGTALFLDSILLDPEHGDLRARMGRFDAFATLVVVGPQAAPIREAALALALPARDRSAPRRAAPLVIAASPLGQDGAVVRIAGTSVEAVTVAVRKGLQGIGDLLGDAPFARKW
jgi:urease accessory protein